MGVLSCRTVGIHGRDSLARGGLLSIGLLLVAAAALAQPASSPTDLAAELAPGIASLVPSGSQLTIATTPTAGDAPLALGLERELTRVLTSRGFRIAPAGTESFVQCAPLGTSKATEKPFQLALLVFFTVIEPQ